MTYSFQWTDTRIIKFLSIWNFNIIVSHIFFISNFNFSLLLVYRCTTDWIQCLCNIQSPTLAFFIKTKNICFLFGVFRSLQFNVIIIMAYYIFFILFLLVLVKFVFFFFAWFFCSYFIFDYYYFFNDSTLAQLLTCWLNVLILLFSHLFYFRICLYGLILFLMLS